MSSPSRNLAHFLRLCVSILFFLLTVQVTACTSTPQPPSLVELTDKAKPFLAEQRYGEAVKVLEAAAHAYPHEPTPLIWIGQIYLRQHRWFLAEDAFNRALARDFNHPMAVAGLAETLFNQGRLDMALSNWQRAAELEPRLPAVFTGMGRLYLQQLDFTAAEKAFIQQQTQHRDPTAAWYLAALTAPRDLVAARNYLHSPPDSALTPERDYLLAALSPFTTTSPPGEVAKATGIALAQLELWPLVVHALTLAREQQNKVDSETLAFLGHALTQAGRPSFDILVQANQAAQNLALPLYFQGIYLRQKGSLKSAEEQLRKAVALDPENAAIYAEIAATKSQQGNLSAAESWYIAATKIAKDDKKETFRLLLIRFYLNHGFQLEEVGLPTAEEVVKSYPNEAEAYDILGWMQFLTGSPEKAESTLQQALSLEPHLISARYHLARSLEANGKAISATVEYQRVIDGDISSGYREKVLKELQVK